MVGGGVFVDQDYQLLRARRAASALTAQGLVKAESFAPEALLLGSLLVLLQLIDGVLTAIGIFRFGVSIEGNPVLRHFMIEYGHIPTLAVLKLFAVLVVCLLINASRRLRWVPGALGLVSLIYIITAVIPWTYILFIQPVLS